MPFEIVRNDITQMTVDAIVNTANPNPVIGAGTDSRIHEMAGPELLRARQAIGRIGVGRAAVTPAFRLHAKYVITPLARFGTAAATVRKRCFGTAMTILWSWRRSMAANPLRSR